MSAHSKGEVQVLVNKYVDRAILRQKSDLPLTLATLVRFAWHAGYRAGFRRAKKAAR